MEDPAPAISRTVHVGTFPLSRLPDNAKVMQLAANQVKDPIRRPKRKPSPSGSQYSERSQKSADGLQIIEEIIEGGYRDMGSDQVLKANINAARKSLHGEKEAEQTKAKNLAKTA